MHGSHPLAPRSALTFPILALSVILPLFVCGFSRHLGSGPLTSLCSSFDEKVSCPPRSLPSGPSPSFTNGYVVPDTAPQTTKDDIATRFALPNCPYLFFSDPSPLHCVPFFSSKSSFSPYTFIFFLSPSAHFQYVRTSVPEDTNPPSSRPF